ncbi:MAG TPA: trypsin-like serine protease, partial [Amycolatopsis sp.]|nr:trypsin-like serine protease [Amycolatopsis sp.]
MSKLRRFRIIGLVVAAAVGGVLTAASASAISGGTPAADGTYGFVAKISMDGRACTGALLNPEYVITSADCFPENPQGGAPAKATTATVGRTNLAGTSGHVVKVTNLVTRADRGVVLAKLDTLITDVTPIALGTTAAANGESLRVAGYGRTNNEWVPDWLHTATMSVASSTPTTFALTGDVDTCKGDSGGPAFRETNGRAELVGINSTSWQHGCLTVTETRQGSTETRTDDIAGWINQQIQPQTVSLKNHYTGRCLAVQGGNNVNEAGAFQYDCAPKFPDRVWKIEPVDGGVQIRNQFTQRCLTVLASNNVNE